MLIRPIAEIMAWREYSEKRRIIFTDDLVRQNFPRNLLGEAVEQGKWVWICPGVYRRKDTTLSWSDRVAITASKYPRTIFCLTTALQLSSSLLPMEPKEIWVALPKGARAPVDSELGLKVVRLASPFLEEGVVASKIEGGIPSRAYNIPKTAIDCFKFRRHVGIGVAVSALRFSLDFCATREELIRLARLGRVEEIVRSHIASWTKNDWVEDPESSDPEALRLSEDDPLAPGRKPGRPKKVIPSRIFRVCPEIDGEEDSD